MKNSINPTGTGSVVLHQARWVFAAILAGSMAFGCGPQGVQAPVSPQPGQFQPAPQAQQSGLVGQWSTVIGGNPLTLTIEANGQYMQVGQIETGMRTQTGQSGPYTLIAPNTIVFTVTDWSPKTRWLFVPNPKCGVPGVPSPTNPQRDSCHQQQEETMAQPPGSRYAYVFNGPNSMTLNNETAQETITFTRVTGQ